MAELILFTPNRALDLNGDSEPYAKASFFAAGTSDPVTVYADADMTIPHPTPLVADGTGIFPTVYSDVPLGCTVTSQNDVVMFGYPLPLVASIPAGSSAAAGITFNPTAEIPETTVQAAIERVQENIVEPLADFGLGVTGDAGLLASLDATDTASGAYRFSNATTGTFPTGYTVTSGVVEIWRQSAAIAWQWLYTGGLVYLRRLNTTWEPWREVISAPAGSARGDTIYRGLTVWARLAKGSANQVLAMGADDPAWVGGNVGVGQTWQKPTRVSGTSYQNTTGRPITIIVKLDANIWLLQASTNGSTWVTIGMGDGSSFVSQSAIIPPGHYYRATGGAVGNWAELR